MIRVSRVLLVGIVLLLAATNAWAQATAQINGTVADSSGGVLTGVTVVAIQTETDPRSLKAGDIFPSRSPRLTSLIAGVYSATRHSPPQGSPFFDRSLVDGFCEEAE
jgi:hypothetical protein